jgi:hypothetical protein
MDMASVDSLAFMEIQMHGGESCVKNINLKNIFCVNKNKSIHNFYYFFSFEVFCGLMLFFSLHLNLVRGEKIK